MDRESFVSALMVALLAFVCGLLIAWQTATRSEGEICRHAIQRTFGKTREQAQSIIDDTRKWEEE